jgi:glycosyltransferase involved in cell wall biosynthesis
VKLPRLADRPRDAGLTEPGADLRPRMKCLFVALGIYTGVGGMERFNQRVVKCLSELGASHHLLAKVVVLWDSQDQRRHVPASVGFTPGAKRKFRTAAAFAWNLLRIQPDVVLYGHILLSPLALVGRVLSPRSRHLLFVHGIEVWLKPFRQQIPVWERAAVRLLIDRVVAVSRFTAERMKTAYGIREEVLRLLPNAVDLDPAGGNGRPDSSDRNGAPRLLTVTRLSRKDRYKGCDKVIRALPTVLAAVPDAHYDIVGDGPLRPQLRELAEQLGVESRVHLHGYVEDQDLETLYGRARVMVMPSTGEGFGIVFLEAWKHSLPVVAGNKDASSEVVQHGWNGLCVDPDSVEAIAEALIMLLCDSRLAWRMGRNGNRTVMERYTHEHFCQRLAELLREADAE